MRTVACTLDNHFFNKHCLVLVHDLQSSGKTTFCRWLCPPALRPYYLEHFSTDKDSLLAMTENFLVNLDELSALTTAELNQFKSFLSTETVAARRPYASQVSKAPRRCSFVGSTNRTEFLADETGSVRWLCFQLQGSKPIDFAYRRHVPIDRLYAQALHLYRSRFDCELTPLELDQNESANLQFRALSEEAEYLLRYAVPGQPDCDAHWLSPTELIEALNHRFHLEAKGRRLSSQRMGKALVMYKYPTAKRRRANEYPLRRYCVQLLGSNGCDSPHVSGFRQL